MNENTTCAQPEQADRKMRFCGILENPIVSMVQRGIMDAGRVSKLRQTLKKYPYFTVLDVGCGLGENSAINKERYVGLDNSLPRVQFAAKRHNRHTFLSGDAMRLPFIDAAFDLTLLIDTSHHLSDEQLHRVLGELKRVSRKYIVISDPILTEKQNRLSAFFYSLDRGACFRHALQMRKIIDDSLDLAIMDQVYYRTFPGFYSRVIFVLEKLSV